MELSQEFKLVKFTAQTVLINRFYRSKIKTYLIPSLEIYIYIIQSQNDGLRNTYKNDFVA
jgi:hypothetical protein